ncbi:MAG: hypothetical protein OXC82_10510 [Rhodobacteraceae bacterium]|nr:hypothetical protein [Paracoccaceae bacterium]MCY4250847.1 hypothetical protein [Paracoccaceae bacterium]MCY4306865.1 hypothetical protein [Paracoccaceae bacterium]
MRIALMILFLGLGLNGCGYKDKPIPEAGIESTFPENPQEEVLF